MELARWEQTPVEALSQTVWRQVIWGAKGNLTRFTLASGAHVLSHQHQAEQFTSVDQGVLRLRVGAETHILRAGDLLVIPANTEHEAWALEDTVVLDFFAPPRNDWRDGHDDYLSADG